MSIRIPKAELHCHLEGAASPALVRQLAERNGVRLPDALFRADGEFAWLNFGEFLDAYDMASGCLRHPADYRDVTAAYLAACAAEGAIYVEMFSSPDHAAAVGMDYGQHLEGIIAGIDDAERQHGIIGRIIVTCVRHLGSQRAREIVSLMIAERHPYVVGFGMGGNENAFEIADFAPAFNAASQAGYACTVHAGEVAGAQSVRAAIDALPVSRIGHGVRAADDPALLEILARRGIVLEVCPGSNMAIGLYPDYASHPLPKLMAAGCRVTLNSDDPPYFATSIGREYARAAEQFGLSDAQLAAITRTAIDGAFVSVDIKRRLLTRLDSTEAA